MLGILLIVIMILSIMLNILLTILRDCGITINTFCK